MLIRTSRNNGRTKPKQWGSLSDVRSNVFRRAESVGIGPEFIRAFFPFWEGGGNCLDVVGGHMATPENSNVYYVGEGIRLYNPAMDSGNELTTDVYLPESGSIFSRLRYVDFSGASRGYVFSHSGSSINGNFCLEFSNSGDDVVFNLGGDSVGNWSVEPDFLSDFKTHNVLMSWNLDNPSRRIYEDSTLILDSSTSITDTYTSLQLKIGLRPSGTYYAPNAIYENLLVTTAEITEEQNWLLYDRPHILLEPMPVPVYFDFNSYTWNDWSTGWDFTTEGSGSTIYSESCLDGLSMSDALSVIGSLGLSCADGINTGDSLLNNAIMGSSCIDGTSLGDNVSRAASFVASILDGARLSDTATRSSIINMMLSDGVVTGDLPAAVSTMTALSISGLDVSDLPSNIATIAAGASDAVTFSDSTLYDALNVIEAACSDGINFGDIVSLIATYGTIATDGISYSDAPSVQAILNDISQDGVEFSESIGWGSVISLLAQDGVELSDQVSYALQLLVQCIDSITLTDSASSIVNFEVVATDQVQFTESVAAIMHFVSSVSDGFTVSATPSYPLGSTAYRTVTISYTASKSSISFTVKMPTITFDC